jgi:predicted kinase
MRQVTLVTGPPCAGKTTHVERHAHPGDLVACFDELARKAGSRNRHRHTREQRAAAGAAFRRLTATLPTYQGTAWVVRCAPTAEERAALADEVQATTVLVLMPPMAVCLRRAQAAGREPRVPGVIRRWYAIYSPLDLDQLIEPGGAPRW